jgi:hypothetical protein
MSTTPADDSLGGSGLFVITLGTARVPMALRVPFVHELVGFSVFRSRTVEAGGERYRLHLGYFESATRAKEALLVVRRYYPTAWISSAPAAGLGSLDDTTNTPFRMIRHASARVVTPAAAPETPERGEATAKVTNVETRSSVDSPTAAGPQRYAVQLDWSLTPISWTAVPRLAVFRAFNLYTVRTSRGGEPEYGLRLGFFRSVDGARQVAEHVRAHYPHANVVPVSDRECERAIELTHLREQQAMADPRAARPPAPSPATAAPSPPSRDDLLSRLGANELSVDDNPDNRSTEDAEARLRTSRRLPRDIRSW